ncbi:MAG: ClC family H(+)/Cl(-) exchange transporter [Spirochaetia bacterium]|jgi:H+/Cl- antiporter ClcA|nr:ClC family H(+)/Cl(-) exchange transporter [Spirochaetia bacterium]
MRKKGLPAAISPDNSRTGVYLYSVLVGIASGLIIVGYRSLIAFFEQLRLDMLPSLASSLHNGTGIGVLLLWLLIASAAGLIVAMMVRRSPYIRGSGIPQVKAVLMRRITADWKLELPFKFPGGSLALGAGLSLGREGPSIQLGSLAGIAISEVSRQFEYRRYLVTAGAAAGISAAFNAPLAGVLFCIEELHRNISPVMLTSSLIASFCANAIMWATYGGAPVFGISLAQVLPLNQYFTTVLAIGIGSAVVGSLFNRGILGFQKAYRTIVPNNTLRIVSAFAVAAMVSLILPAITGGGDHLIEALVHDGYGLRLVSLLLVGKILFTLFSYASGTPGGIFLPMLAIGALIGTVSQGIFMKFGIGSEYLNNYILVGMVGFFTAVVRAPITGAVLITEMAGSFAHFPAFILVSVVASLVSEMFHTKPIYDSLLTQISASHPRETLSRPIVLYIPVQEGSILETCCNVQAHLPDGCILAGVEHGEKELFPDKDMDIQPGDVLRIIVESGKAPQLKERLLLLGEASKTAKGHE